MEDEQKYLAGTTNRLIRYWYYLENGLSILNEFRNLFLAIIAIYLTLHVTDLTLIGLITIGSLVILTVLGYYYVHRFARVKEWVNIKFSTHYSIRSFDYQKENNELLKQILQEIKDKEF